MLFPNIHLLEFGILFSYAFFCTFGEKPNSSVGAHIAAVRFSVLECELKTKNYSRVKNRLLLEFSFFVNK